MTPNSPKEYVKNNIEPKPIMVKYFVRIQFLTANDLEWNKKKINKFKYRNYCEKLNRNKKRIIAIVFFWGTIQQFMQSLTSL